ncbi:hypothetical protein ACHAW6_000520 [Cyclotella cf. meneghiniana]
MKVFGIIPTRQVFDNETSSAYKKAITDSGMDTDTKFPLHLWCQLLPQMECQLSRLGRNSYPHISAYADLYGHHDYNTHPFVPIGMKAIVHDKHL